MGKIIKDTIHAKGIDIGIYTTNFESEFISLTDIAKYRNEDDPRFVIQNWMRNRNTVEFLGVWEELHNPDFNRVQSEAVKNRWAAELSHWTGKAYNGLETGQPTCTGICASSFEVLYPA